MNKKRLVETFMDMVKIYSPSKEEKELTDYLIKILKDLGGEIHLDLGYKKYGGKAPSILCKFKGDMPGPGLTLAAHTDVVGPNKNVRPILDGNLIKTDGTTTLGGDDKAGIASILETIRFIKEEKKSHSDIFILLTPCEEIGMLGSKNFDWKKISKDMYPSKNIIVVDNAGKAGLIAYAAPSNYSFQIEFIGKTAHAGIEPEKGVNSIFLASQAISKMKIGRIDENTSTNIYSINSNFPSNVVPDRTLIKGEIRSHQEKTIIKLLEDYQEICKLITLIEGDFKFSSKLEYPPLKTKDNLNFARELKVIYESLNIGSQLVCIGGGSDANILAEEGFNSVIVGVGMENVHTVNEYLDLDELEKTTRVLIKYITKEGLG